VTEFTDDYDRLVRRLASAKVVGRVDLGSLEAPLAACISKLANTSDKGRG